MGNMKKSKGGKTKDKPKEKAKDKTKDKPKGKGKPKGKEEEKGEDLKTCNFVKARHILCEKQSKALEAFNKLKEAHGMKPPAAEFAKVATEYSEDAAKKGGDLGWFPRGKMAGPFQEVAFSLSPGTMSDLVKTVHGYHIIFVEGRKAKLQI
eukprot:TRINITY_DN3100_c0_g1_i3.p2 TRINITY_DN3100_c0_g1~~TRINITY_DN3100_c0_g1_i3.p2  ORF type:complete len:151 (+),score=37.99 TRINITY_DN3100_c0_g1_i3:203-655(+)